MFEDILFVGVFLLLPLMWHLLLKVAGLDLRIVSVPSILIIFFYIYQYMGLPVLYFQLNDYRFSSGVDDKFLVLQVFFYTSLTMTFMMFGFVLGKQCFGTLHYSVSNELRVVNKVERTGIILIFAICVAVLCAYVARIGFHNVAIVKMIELGRGGIGAARSAMGNAFDGKYHWYYLFMNKLMLFCSFIFFAQILTRKSYYNKVLFGVAFLFTTFSMVMTTSKGPMAQFLVGLFLIYVIIRRRGAVSVRGLASFSVILAILLIAFYMQFMGTGSPLQALLNMLSRVFTGAIQPAYHYLEYFPKHHEYLFGKSLPNPGGILPFETYSLSIEMSKWQTPEAAGMGVVGSMPAVYWGEMYANFGFWGVLFPPFFVGLIVYWFDFISKKFEITSISIAFYVWLILRFKDLSVSPLSGYMLDIYLMSVVLSYFILLFIGGKGVIKLRRKTPA